MVQATQLDEKCGLFITYAGHDSGASILDLDPAVVKGWLMTRGVVLFRSFAINVSSFVKFTDQFLQGALVHGSIARRQITSDDTVQEVTPGNTEIEFHAELALTPLRPHLLWFYCEKPAASDGETTLCDGIRVFNMLTPQTRALFTENQIRYVGRVAPEGMKRRFPELSFADAIAAATKSAAPGYSIKLVDGRNAETQYITSAVTKTRWGGQPAFANSITGPYRTRKWVGFDNGEPISAAVMAEIRSATATETVLIKWQAGDLVMIDNSRIMHGRRSFTGQRSIYVRMGQANW